MTIPSQVFQAVKVANAAFTREERLLFLRELKLQREDAKNAIEDFNTTVSMLNDFQREHVLVGPYRLYMVPSDVLRYMDDEIARLEANLKDIA